MRYESIFMCWDGVGAEVVCPCSHFGKEGANGLTKEEKEKCNKRFFLLSLSFFMGMPPKDIDWTLQTRDCVLNKSGSQVEGARHGRGVWMDVGGQYNMKPERARLLHQVPYTLYTHPHTFF